MSDQERSDSAIGYEIEEKSSDTEPTSRVESEEVLHARQVKRLSQVSTAAKQAADDHACTELKEALTRRFLRAVQHSGVSINVQRTSDSHGAWMSRAANDTEVEEGRVAKAVWTIVISKGPFVERVSRLIRGALQRSIQDPMQALALVMYSLSQWIMLVTLSVYTVFMVTLVDEDKLEAEDLPNPWGAYAVAISFVTFVVIGPILTFASSRQKSERVREIVNELSTELVILNASHPTDRTTSKTSFATVQHAATLIPRIQINDWDGPRLLQLIVAGALGFVAVMVMTLISRGIGVVLGLIGAVMGRSAILEFVETNHAVIHAAIDALENCAHSFADRTQQNTTEFLRRVGTARRTLDAFITTLTYNLF